MQPPLSRTKRTLYLFGLVLVFVAAMPFLLLYATGYRLDSDFTLVKTGGLFVGVGESGARVYIDGTLTQKTSLLDKDVFIQDLLPGLHTVKVEKDDRVAWSKVLGVFPQRVTESYPFLIPVDIKTKSLVEGTEDFDFAVTLFATTTTKTLAVDFPYTEADPYTEQSQLKEKSGMLLWQDGNVVYARWNKKEEKKPGYFCDGSGLCRDIIPVFASQFGIRHFDFYPNGNNLIVVATARGIFLVEIDDRSQKNIVPLYDIRGALFRVDGGKIYIKDRGMYSELLI